MKLSEALKLTQNMPEAETEKFRVYLACGFTPLHLATFLQAHLRQRSPLTAPQILTGEYGDLLGTLERLQKSQCEAAALVIEWSDLDPRLALRSLGGWGPDVLEDIQRTVESFAMRMLGLIKAAAPTVPFAVCLATLPLPPIFYRPTSQSDTNDLRLRKLLQDFALRAAEIPNVIIVNRQRLDELSPLSDRRDVKSELMTGFPYGLAHASILGDLLSQLILPTPAKKGLITDLDDTLWRGLLGEDGVAGVSWDLDNRSHIHGLYQQLLSALAKAGVLIGIASKNDRDLVLEAFAREDLLLSRDQVFPLEINWQAKSGSVTRILKAWNVNADSVVFVDDSPMELAEVKALYPEMECLLFPKDDDDAAYALLIKLREFFGKPEILEEDAIRMQSIRSARDFQSRPEENADASVTDFLKAVDARVTIGPIDNEGEARAFQLINKTNQFNLNGRRLSNAEFQNVLSRPDAVSLLVSYRDKFGPLGKIAVLLGTLNASVIRIKSWVMSCRAFSRHIEHACLNYLFENFDVGEIELDYQETPRNGPLREFLSQFLDDKPASLCKIPREVFQNRKPDLFHIVNNVDE